MSGRTFALHFACPLAVLLVLPCIAQTKPAAKRAPVIAPRSGKEPRFSIPFAGPARSPLQERDWLQGGSRGSRN